MYPLKSFCRALIVLAFISSPQIAYAMEAGTETYEDLLARLKNGDTAIDYAAFRQAYTKSADYSPYGGPPLEAMYEASNNGDHAAAIEEANKILETNYTNLDAHAVAYYSYNELGDTEHAEYHWSVGTGLHASIADSGDGMSPDTAYVVISVDEEYAFLRLEGIRVTGQSLVMGAGGTPVDALQVVDVATGEPLPTVYFDVSAAFLWMDKAFSGLGDAPANAEPPDTP